MKLRGIVKWFSDDKGYGFIERKGSNPDVFVHFTGIETTTGGRRKLEQGQTVEFYIEEDKQTGKLHAVAVTIVSEVAS